MVFDVSGHFDIFLYFSYFFHTLLHYRSKDFANFRSLHYIQILMKMSKWLINKDKYSIRCYALLWK